MSGLHASINTDISDRFPPQGSKKDTYNQTYFLERIGNHRDRVKNLYFLYAVVVKAVAKMEPVLLSKDFDTGIDDDNPSLTKLLVRDIIRSIDS